MQTRRLFFLNRYGGDSIKSIILLEQTWDLNIAFQKFDPNDPSFVFIALNPQVSYELERKGVFHKTTLDYGGSYERNLDCVNAYRTVNNVLMNVDQQVCQVLKKYQKNAAKFPFFYVKCLFDVIQSKIHLLKEIIAHEKPETIIVFESRHTQNRSFVAFSEDNSVYSQLLELDGWTIPVIRIPSDSPLQIPPMPAFLQLSHIIADRIRTALRKNSFFFNNGMLVKRKGLRYSLHISFYSAIGKKQPVVLFGSGYNWDDALLELYRAGFHPIIRCLNTDTDVNRPDDEKRLKDLLLNIFKDSDLIKKASGMYGIDASPLLFEKLSVILAKSIIDSQYAYQHFSDLMLEKKPDSVLISTQAHPVDRAFIQAARDNKIAVISWQHGGGGYCYHPLMQFAEFIESDVHLVFGCAVKVSYINISQKLGIGPTPRIIEVGSSTLDSERETLTADSTASSDNGPIIYITERFLNNFYYISTSYDATSINDMLWLAQKKFLGVAKQNPGINFIFKLHPSDLPGEPCPQCMQKTSKSIMSGSW